MDLWETVWRTNPSRYRSVKPLELRASVALGKLLQAQDRGLEAYDTVAPVFEVFTEGFDTPDLKEAKALLDHLS